MFLYYIVRTLQTHIRKYMGTTNKKYPNIIGLSRDFIFFKSSNTTAYFIIMSTLIFTYGYNPDLYYLLFYNDRN